jgi:hypothetical protein
MRSEHRLTMAWRGHSGASAVGSISVQDAGSVWLGQGMCVLVLMSEAGCGLSLHAPTVERHGQKQGGGARGASG